MRRIVLPKSRYTWQPRLIKSGVTHVPFFNEGPVPDQKIEDWLNHRGIAHEFSAAVDSTEYQRLIDTCVMPVGACIAESTVVTVEMDVDADTEVLFRLTCL